MKIIHINKTTFIVSMKVFTSDIVKFDRNYSHSQVISILLPNQYKL